MTTQTKPHAEPRVVPRPPDDGRDGRRDGRRAFVTGVTLLAAALSLAAGAWALIAPHSFATFTGFEPYNRHFVHDLGAFQLGIGVALLLSTAWRDAPAVALAGFLAGDAAHAVSHWVDLGIG